MLAEGLILVMFPEATRSKNAQLQSAFPGAALIALHCGVPILPVAVAGTERIKGITWMLRRPPVTITFGNPFNLTSVNGKMSKEELA